MSVFLRILIVLACLTIPPLMYAKNSIDKAHLNNSIGFFLGATTGEETTDFSYGLEYQRLLNDRLAVKTILEHTPNSEEGKGDLVNVFLLSVRVLDWFYVGAGPGYKRIFKHETLALGRVEFGLGVDLPHGFELAPDFSLDFIEHGDLDKVYGIMLIKYF